MRGTISEVCRHCTLCEERKGWDESSAYKEIVLRDIDSQIVLITSGLTREEVIGSDGEVTSTIKDFEKKVGQQISIAFTVRCSMDPGVDYDAATIMCSVFNRMVVRSYPYIIVDREAFDQLQFRDREWNEGTWFVHDYSYVLMAKDVGTWTGVDVTKYVEWAESLDVFDKTNIILEAERLVT